MNSNIPQHVIDSVSCLLSPYGVNFSELINGNVQQQRYMTAKQASLYTGLQPKTLRDKALSGEIRSIRIGHSDKSRVLLEKADIDRWLATFASEKQQTA